MTSLGQELKKQRESLNISIDEMASSTKIVGRYLEDLEQDRFDAMPGGFFINGIIRTYAKCVGLDEAEVLAKYRESGVLDEPAKPRASEAGAEAARRRPAVEGKSKTIVWLFVAAAVLVLLVAVTMALRSRRPHPAPPAVKPAAGAVPRTEDAPTREEPKQEPPLAPVVKEAAREEWTGLTLDMRFQEETWVQVYADGVLKVSGLFPAGGTARAVAEKEILIGILGNAGGLSYELNGKPGKALGRTGEVKNNIRITLDNLKEYLREPTAPSS